MFEQVINLVSELFGINKSNICYVKNYTDEKAVEKDKDILIASVLEVNNIIMQLELQDLCI